MDLRQYHDRPNVLRRFVLVAVLAMCAIGTYTFWQPRNAHPEIREGAERLANDLPAVAQIDSDPRKTFANSLGKILTVGFDWQGSHVTVLTWNDVDRTKMKLLGAVLDIPPEVFARQPNLAGCDQASYNRGQCRFDLDFSAGTLQIFSADTKVAYKTSDADTATSRHL